MEPTNSDLQKTFESHAQEDQKFQDETRETDKGIQATLLRIEARLEVIESKVDIMWNLIEGLSFSGKALKYVAGIFLAIAAIVGTLFAFIRFVK